MAIGLVGGWTAWDAGIPGDLLDFVRGGVLACGWYGKIMRRREGSNRTRDAYMLPRSRSMLFFPPQKTQRAVNH
jgi:hypothetical protein